MGEIRVISSSIVQASTTNLNGNNASNISVHNSSMELSPLDLNPLLRDPIQQGLLFCFPHPKPSSISTIIDHLKHSLSSTLHFFPPLAGRLSYLRHDGAASFFIDCNNAGALFLHAVADDTAVSDILNPTYVPAIIYSFFPLNGIKNHEGTSHPLLAVQLTELNDGVFLGFTMNHSVVDGTSFWHFINSWSQISCTSSSEISKLPLLQRWFPNDITRPLRIHFPNPQPHNASSFSPRDQRMFHFPKLKISELKTKANAEAKATTISSLQAILSHIWRAVTRNQDLDPSKEMKCILGIGVRGRLHPPVPDNYFGNAVQLAGTVSMKASELVEEGGLGKAAWEMNKMVGSNTREKIKSRLDSFLENPRLQNLSDVIGDALLISNSPRFDIYCNDFGWGKPVGVRSGAGNKRYGKVTLFAGAEDGSIDIEACLSLSILEALGNDPEFMAAVGH